MSKRTRYEVIDPKSNFMLSFFTLYGDHDDDALRVLNAMIREWRVEGVAITGLQVLVRVRRVEA